MRVDHGGGHIRMPQQFLNRADVAARLQQVGGEAVPQNMLSHPFGDLPPPRPLPGRSPATSA